MREFLKLLFEYKSLIRSLVAATAAATLIQASVFFVFPFLNIVICDTLVVTLDKVLLLKILAAMEVRLMGERFNP